MELTHKLVNIQKTYHTETKRRLLEAFKFTYQLTNAASTATWFVLDEDSGGYPMFRYPHQAPSTARNISKETYIPAGSYVAVVNNPNGYVRLFKVRTRYYANETAELIGEYSDGDVIVLTDVNAYYFIEDDNMESLANMGNYLSSYEEYQEQVPTEERVVVDIDEPIGFDNLKTTMQRHEYHGMGAEVSLDNLEFYGKAFDVISAAYTANIDSEVLYEVYADAELLYRGQIDLSTYNEKKGDYQSVSVKAGEIGIKTTFNNRTETAIDLSAPKTIDGLNVESPLWQQLHIPLKHLLYTNNVRIVNPLLVDSNQEYQHQGVVFDIDTPYIFLPFGDTRANEFGTLTFPIASYNTDDITAVAPQYTPDSDHDAKFGQNTEAKVDARFIITAQTSTTSFEYNPTGNFYYRLCITDGSTTLKGEQLSIPLISIGRDSGKQFHMDCSVSGTLSASNNIKVYLEISYGEVPEYTRPYRRMQCDLTLERGTFFKMTMYDTITEEEPVNADMLLVHDALNVVSHAISENALAVRSEWYRTPISKWESGTLGGGALKALTNGYKIRGLFTDGENERNMPLSFKDLITSLDALDCIGWGFSTEGNDTCVRVERWDWFYKTNVVLTLTNIAEMQIEVYPDSIFNEFRIGYKKYATVDQYNSIESPHGTRTFANGIKAVSKSKACECEFIADNYAIEETRRAKLQKGETEETTYDENIFVFELLKLRDVYYIDSSAIDAENVGRASEFINAKLTPRHMASRWRSYLFSTNNTTPFRFQTGEINYKASFQVRAEEGSRTNPIQSLRNFYTSSPQAENDDITYTHAIFKAEKITFSYPLTIAQYKAVKANPYGLISANGLLGWILDFKYSFANGMADFTLIAKY